MKNFLIRIFLLFAAALSLTVTSTAQTKVKTPKRKKVGLVLSGGGAKGAAQLRIIKAIEEAGIPIDYVAGTSIGSIIGGLYSVGYTVDEIEEIFKSANWYDIFLDRNDRKEQLFANKHKDDTYMFEVFVSPDNISLPSGIIRGDKFTEILNDLLLGYQEVDSFNDLPTPFACVSYDMSTGSEYVARGGNLTTAIRASMSIPGVFKPVKMNDMLLVDGGVFNNFPVDVVREMGAEIVIGIDLSQGIKSDKELENIVGLFDQITTFLGREKFDENVRDCDYYMHPDISGFSSASFSVEAIDSLIVRGQHEADANRDGLRQLRKKIGLPEGYMPPKRQRHYSDSTEINIGEIKLSGFSKAEKHRIARFMKLQPNTVMTRGEFNRCIQDIKNSGGFSFVTYSLNSQPPYNLDIAVNEKENTSLNVGFRFDTQEMAALLLNTQMTLRGDVFKPQLGLTARLSQNPYVMLTANTNRVMFGNFGFSYKFQYENFTFYKNYKRSNTSTFGLHNVSLHLSDIYLRNFNMTAGIEYEYFDYRSSLYAEGETTHEIKPEGYLNYKVSGHYESLDDFYLPKKGYSFKASYVLHTSDNEMMGGSDTPFASVGYGLYGAFTPIPQLTFIPSVYGRTLIGVNPTYPYFNCIGGVMGGRYMPQQLPFVGIQNIELADNSIIIGAVEARFTAFRKHYFSLLANYATQDDQFVEMFKFKDTLLGFGIKYSYETSLGPVSIVASGTAKHPWGGIYLSFGKNF